MKKTDLKYCDVVEMRNGEIYILLKGGFKGNDSAFMNVRTGCYVSFDYRDGVVCCDYSSDYDIMKVKHFKYPGDAFRTLGMLENYPKKEIEWDWERKKYYDGKIVCVNNDKATCFTKGKIYTIKDGVLTDDIRDTNLTHYSQQRIKSFNDIKEYFNNTFIELVGD